MKKYLFCSYPDFSDNSRSLFDYMVEKNFQGKYIWLYSSDNSRDHFKKVLELKGHKDVKLVKKNTIHGLYHYLTANYLFCTHGMFEQIPILPWQKKINLWHGMPLKKIGMLLPGSVKMRMSYSISNGSLFNKYIEESFNLESENVIKIGSPRNDTIVKPSLFNFHDIFNNDYPVIAWLPTYRKTVTGVNRSDGIQLKNSISGLNMEDLYTLNEELMKSFKNLFIKLHPMDILNEDEHFISQVNSLSNIKISGNNNQLFPNDSLYHVLRNTDSLITDYSSIYFDYLLLDKPIAILSNDRETYKKNRGFIDNIQENYVGFFINSMATFVSFINMDEFGRDKEIQKLRQVKEVFQTYDNKGRNCENLLKILNIKS